jgi:hypothetical protein
MTPIPEWRRVLRHAWSVRFLAAAGVLSAGASAVSMIDGQAIGHPALIPALAFGLNIAALASRLVQQKDVP